MSECRIFAGAKDKYGYGITTVNGRSVRAHRKSYADANDISMDEISGLVVRHVCDNPSCINPDHLLIGTQSQNIQDKVDRNRQAKGSENGQSVLSESDVSEIRKLYKKGVRGCGTYALAKKYGVNQSTIFRAVAGLTWDHVH